MKQQKLKDHKANLPEGDKIKLVSPDSNVEVSAVDDQAPPKE